MQTRYLLIGLLALCFFGCPGPEKEITEVGTTRLNDESRHFFYAWLADCVNDQLIDAANEADAIKAIQQTANQRISNAIQDDNIKDGVGDHSLVWGPVVITDQPEAGEYTSKNLAYCLKRNFAADSAEYIIGIAGTNPFSSFDWFEEDLDVSNAETGPSYWDQAAMISAGSLLAMDSIKGLRDKNGVSLYDKLNKVVTAKDHISVSGHSLGGALTQVLSYDLQLVHPKKHVSAWVYAGPSAGNSIFADRVSKVLKGGYHAHNNKKDVIPHVWQKSKLNELCIIYNGDQFKKEDHWYSCYTQTIEEVPPIDGTIQYFKNISASVDYQTPQPVYPFTGKPLSLDTEYCLTYDAAIEALLASTSVFGAEYYSALNTITTKCTDQKNVYDSQFKKFFAYLTELGYEHTVAYSDHFFGEHPFFAAAADKYVPGMSKDSYYNYFISSPFEAFDYVLEPFLNKIAGGLPENEDCGCS